MDNDVLNIYSDDIEIAQSICKSISDSNARSRAVANNLAVKLAERYLTSKNYEADTKSGLHNIPNVVENIDIADLYINGTYIDARVYFSSDEISVPKLHFDLGITPAAYMFIKLEQDLTSYTITGFIRPEYIDRNKLKDDYYYVDESSLISFYDMESHFTTVNDTFNGSKELLYSFVEGSADESGISELLKILITSENARVTLIKAFKAKTVFKYVSVQETPVITEKDEQPVSPEDSTNETVEEIAIDTASANDEDIENSQLYNDLEFSTEVTPSELDLIDQMNTTENEQTASTQNEEQIDSLFTGEQEGVPVTKKKKSSPITMIILIIALIASCGYLVSTRLSSQNNNDALPADTLPGIQSEEVVNANEDKPKEVAMPNETVDTSSNAPAPTEEASPIAIPAIEQHLDASVLVANLKVDWEVPAGYASNTAAKRYLVKLGKVIQLNLKSELLLLNKPPISNRITVELTYDAVASKFNIVGIKDSSGEKTVDQVIYDTIKNSLDYSLSSNTESFGKLQGNPVLIIHL